MTEEIQGLSFWRTTLAALTGRLVVLAARLITGLRSQWHDNAAMSEPTLYFGNHTSHGDFVLIWAGLPPELRGQTRPVAGQDYWQVSCLRSFIGADVFRALMIQRDAGTAGHDPIQQMAQVLYAGDSLIMFPEGTRNVGDTVLLPFKRGLYHLARECPQARLVPVWIDNIRRVLPKGTVLPVPLACTVHYGAPIRLHEGEDKTAFLARARQAMLDLRPEHDRRDDVHGNPWQEP
ncbi:Uncharacterised protein [uncultured Comamonas sp.]|nr:Uncharacterised protein [uncultured Comamonas sp.]